MSRVYWFIAWVIGLSTGLNLAHAQPRAWLDRDQIQQNESVILSIETDEPNVEPDYRPLETDFILGARSRSQQMQLTPRSLSHSSQFVIKLTPRRSGLLTIGPLVIGQHKTITLLLNVTAYNAGNSSPFDEVFVQTRVDSTRPYVQQNVGIVVRLGHAVPIVRGDLNLPEPDNATLQRIGEDHLHKENINGREYTVLERRFILVPEHSGPLSLQGAYFKGITGSTRLNGGRVTVATSDKQTLEVQALPSPLPQPWRPLHTVQLRYRLLPDTLKAGEAATLEIEATATGARQPQLNELPVPELEGAGQIFAEPVSAEETFTAASPELKLVRRYTIVPQHAGDLVIKGIKIPWWNVETGQLVNTSLPSLTLPVQGVAGQSNALPTTPDLDAANNAVSLAQTELKTRLRWLWPLLTILFALLWLGTLAWMLITRRNAVTANKSVALPRSTNARNYHLPDLRRALEQGSIDEVLQMLVRMSGTSNLDAALARLADPQQRKAIEAVQRARWRGEGDLSAVRTQLNHAFAKGPQWKITASVPVDELPPLYPTARI